MLPEFAKTAGLTLDSAQGRLEYWNLQKTVEPLWSLAWKYLQRQTSQMQQRDPVLYPQD